MSNNPSQQQQTVTFSSFVPLVILTIGFGVILLWTLVAGVQELDALRRQRDQLLNAQFQAVGVEEKMKALMEGLLTLAETDPDAKAIADKYQVKLNPPASGTQPLTPDKTGTSAPAGKKSPLPAVTSVVTEAKAPAADGGR
jgi:hypothetical protein